MSEHPDPERLVLEDLTDQQRRALPETVDPRAALLVDRLATALRSLDEDARDAAKTPPLRVAPEGAEKPTPIWARFCVRGDAGEHQVAAPTVALGVSIAVLLAFTAGLFARDATEPDAPSGPESARLDNDTKPPLSKTRTVTPRIRLIDQVLPNTS